MYSCIHEYRLNREVRVYSHVKRVIVDLVWTPQRSYLKYMSFNLYRELNWSVSSIDIGLIILVSYHGLSVGYNLVVK